MSEGSLWGDLSTLKTIRTPKTILVEQAEIFNQTTGGVVRAQVNSNQNGTSISHTLQIIAPALGNYVYAVCQVAHDIEVYPCKIYSYQWTRWTDCPNEESVKTNLATILSAPKTRQVIEALLSQSK